MSTIDGNVLVKGSLSVQGNLYAPAESINNDHISSNANKRIAATKVVHQFPVARQLFGPATTITAITETLYTALGAAEVVAVNAVIETAATGADRTVSIDIQRSSGGSFTTILSAPISLDDSSDVRTAIGAAITDADLAAGDTLQAVVTVAGSDAAQALGLLITVHLREEPA